VTFRPIDVKMGPDGAIYIADWYNPIIQHGEVDFRDERRFERVRMKALLRRAAGHEDVGVLNVRGIDAGLLRKVKATCA
jgi:hypothetical protein